MRMRTAQSIRRSSLAIKKEHMTYPEMAADVIRISDIVLEICDARFIRESRNKEFEEMVQKMGKKIIYVFNKSDLADLNVISKNLEVHNLFPHFFVSCKTHKGISLLKGMIKTMAKKTDSGFKRVHVGVIGYPNMGKSSIINLLVGRPVALTAFEAGFTKSRQKIRLAKDIIIIDTPGVIPKNETAKEARNVVKQSQITVKTWDTMKDPDIAVFNLIKKNPSPFEKFYGIDASDFDSFIEAIGRKMNFLKKGGIVDVDRASRMVLRDWQEGLIS